MSGRAGGAFRRLTPFIWLAYLAAPVEGWGLFHGRPLGGLGALALSAFCWLWWVRRSMPFARLAVVAVMAKLAVGAALLAPRGFDARYFANAEFTGTPEAGTEPADRSFTRTDVRLRLGGPADDDLPVYFFNDATRFNFFRPNQPDRGSLPVSVTWEGWWRVTSPGVQVVYVSAPGARMTMTIGNGFSASIPWSTTEWLGSPNLKAGFQQIRISLSIPQGGARRVEAGRMVDGQQQAFDDTVVFRKPMTTVTLAADRLARAISTSFDLMICAWLGVGVLRAVRAAWCRLASTPAVSDALTIAWAAIVLDALLFARPALHKMVTLSGGDDWLAYESSARDVGLHGLWMAGGKALGQGTPFYYHPLYSYFVAATHWLFGDDFYGVHLIQRLLAGGTVIALWRMTVTLFGEEIGAAGLVTAVVVVYERVAPWTGVVLTEPLFAPLVCVWALLLVRLACSTTPTLRAAAIAGGVGGVATLTRSTLLAAWALVLPLVALGLARTRRAGRIVAVLGVTLAAVTSLATVRNWVVARTFVVVSSQGPVTLYADNQPSSPVYVPAEHKAAYDRWQLDPFVQTVIEYARQRPREFFEKWRQRGAYALGSFSTLVPDRPSSFFYMTASLLAIVGVLLLVVRRPWRPGAGSASFIPLALAVAHLAPLVVFEVSTYIDRLILPFYALLVPYVAVVASYVHRGLWRIARRGTALAVWLALIGVCVWRLARGGGDRGVAAVTVAVLVWSLCVFGVPRLRAPVAAIYGAMVIALCGWVLASGMSAAEDAARLDLLFLAAVICSSVIVGGLSTLRVPELPGLAWLYGGITILGLVALHVSEAGAPLMTIAGLALGGSESLFPRVRRSRAPCA